MIIKLRLSIEIRRSQPACKRTHADDPPEELPSVTDAHVELARGWDHDVRSPAVAARFGFSPPVTPPDPPSAEDRRNRG